MNFSRRVHIFELFSYKYIDQKILKNLNKIGLGGGCHWCTEAIFQQLKGVERVEQGYISSEGTNSNLSEAVIVHFAPLEISLATLIEIHLYTHKSTSNHSFRKKYRSAVYYYNEDQGKDVEKILKDLQVNFKEPIITQVLKFSEFKSSREEIQNYYAQDPDKPFCKLYIEPKLKILMEQFKRNVKLPAT